MRKNAVRVGSLAIVISLFLLSSFSKSIHAQEQPTIRKDSVQVRAFTVNSFKGNYDNWSWLPAMDFTVNGPIPSGGQLYVEFKLPTGPWVKFDCQTGETPAGDHWWNVKNCGGRDIGEDKGSQFTGMVNFAIKMRNELAGTDITIFNGKAKVEKAHSNEAGPKAVNKWVYFINHDWNLPIGYVYLTEADIYGWKWPNFHVAFWVRGDPYQFDPHVFYQGKEIGKISLDGEQIGKASCEAKVENNTTHYVEDALPQKAKWSRVECDFPNIKGKDNPEEKHDLRPGEVGTIFPIAQNPGEYEVKILRQNHLARSLKFTVAPDGNFDNGIAKTNKLGSNRVIVAVQIMGDQDGTWDRNAWKDAFYGNPLTGFTPLP